MFRIVFAIFLMSASIADAQQTWPTGRTTTTMPSQTSSTASPTISPAQSVAIAAELNHVIAAIATHYTGKTPTFSAHK